MRTALVINQFALPRSQGGGTRHVDLFSRLDGWDYVILAGDRNYASQQPFTAEPPHFRTVSVPGHSGSSRQRILGWGVFAAKATVAGLRQRQVDAVYASSPQMLAAVAGWVVARARRVPFILEIRDLWPDSIAGAGLVGERSRVFRALRQLERTLYHAADRIVVVTGGWEEHFDALGVSRDKLVVIPNGTDEEAFQVDEDREALRAEFGLTRPTAVYAGAHGPANALHLLVQAAKETPELDLLLVGAGTEKDRLRELAAGTPNIRFLDPMPKAELARLLAACDVGVHCIEDLPILERGMSPNKVFDYLAAGLPVVSNAGAGLAKVMRDDECGATGGTNDLAALLRRTVAGLPENRERWVSRGRGILAAGHSRAAASTALESVLDEGNGGKHERSSTRRRIEVAHLTTAHTPTDNRIFRKEVLALHRAGVDVCLVAPAPEDMAVEGVSVIALPKRASRLRRMALGPVDVLRTVRALRPRVLHIHDPELIPLGVICKRAFGMKVVFDAHEDLPKQIWGKPYLPSWSKKGAARFARALEHTADRQFDAIVAATPPIARNFRNPTTVPVQNYPWLSDFPEPTPYGEAPEGSYSYVGGLTRARGAEEMLAAVDRADAHLTVAGPVAADVGEGLTSNDKVTYAGVLPVAEVPGIVASARAGFVLFHPLPNHLECQPTKLFEYMAAARPFIASDFPYWRELLGDDAGLFVDPESVEDIRAAMERLEQDPTAAERMGQAGRRLVEERFTFEGQAQGLIALTRRLLA